MRWKWNENSHRTEGGGSGERNDSLFLLCAKTISRDNFLNDLIPYISIRIRIQWFGKRKLQLNKFRVHFKYMLVSALEQRDVASMLSISLFYYFFLLPSNHFTYSLAFFNASFCVLPRRTFLFLFLAYSCQSHEFRCHNSLCVDRNHLCDGVRHCTDGTDELAENCDKNNIISGKQHLHTFFNIFLYSYAVLKR